MKRWFCLVLAVVMLCAGMSGMAEEAVSSAPPEMVQAVEVLEAPKDLTLYAQGDAVLALQTRLNVLGFFFTAIDGKYGANTRAAVQEFEEYVRLLEQRDIDEMIARLPAATDAPTPEPTPAPSEGVQAVATPDATPTPEPTAEPTPAPTPETVVDGTADVALQALIFGEADELYLSDVALNDSGAAALRIQRRLIALNYLSDTPDSVFGVNSQTALIAFQQAHGLDETGIADRETQKKLFSEDAVAAKRPVYNQLALWSSGDNVKNVQKQLIILGFMNGSASGTVDNATQNGIKALEKYLYILDHPETLSAQQTPEPSPVPSGQEETVQAVEQIVDGASNPDSMVAGDPETNPYEVLPEVQAETADELPGFEATGVMSAAMQTRLLEDGIPVYRMTLRVGDRGDEVMRVQRRLYSLGYLTASGVDGIFGSGTESAIRKFQSRNKMEQTGLADQATQYTLFSEDAVKSIKPYQIKISVDDQRVYVYSPDQSDNYTVLVKTFVCSTGTREHPTPLGTFTNTGRGARWHYFKKFDCWAQYAWYVDGDIMIHSVLYSEKDEDTLRTGSVSALGKRASHGCIRLSVEDAKWIYENCAAGTTVVVY